MRYPVALITFLVLVALPGCSSKTKLPPVSPEDVEIFMPDRQHPPSGSYEVVWQTSDYNATWGSYNLYPGHMTDDRIVEHLKEEAAKRGADALLIDYISKPVTARPDRNASMISVLQRVQSASSTSIRS